MQPYYTQVFARTRRPTQVFGALRDLDAYLFPPTPAGTVACERTSEAIDVRIVVQVAETISWRLGRGLAVLAIAGDNGTGFWCGHFDGGEPRFEHNRLTGPRDFTKSHADPSQLERLCDSFDADAEEVYSALVGLAHESAVERHAALALALGLPLWSPGIGYSRILEGDVPPEAGMPRKAPHSLKDLRPLPEWLGEIDASDSKGRFQQICRRAFGFLVEELGFREPESPDPYMALFHGPQLTVAVEGLSWGARTRLCLVDQRRRLLDFTKLLKRRDPEMLDLCQLASDQREQIPIFAEALRKNAADVLAGNLTEIDQVRDFGRGFSFGTFDSRADADRFLAQNKLHER
jgi:hypothetical protein